MQAIALVTNDKFLLNFNITIDASDVIDYMQKLKREWFGEDYASNFYFLERYRVNFTELISHRGICYDFNIINASQLFHLDRLVENFNLSSN